MIVFHGSTEIIRKPDTLHSYRNLDFGKGFYVTSVRKQAERWALRKADLYNTKCGIVSVYNFAEPGDSFIQKDFDDNMFEWIDFVCSCRNGSSDFEKYDIIKGKVADDKVYRVVNFYRLGIWDKERALEEMKVYDVYDQIAFISQEAIDKLLSFQKSYEVYYE